jgi:3-oxoacyl-[acyl-carrier-protein] synthase II
VRIIREALARSGVTPEGVDYVSSGAFGQPAADRGEATALCEVFGERKIPIGTPSTQLGNTSGAAGAFQAVSTVLAFHHQALPAGNIDGSNGNTSLDLVGESRPGHVDVGLLTTFGEHGDRAALILKNYSMEEKS